MDLPGGGPVYPLSAPFVRVKVSPAEQGFYAQAAVFSGDPTGHDGSNSPNTGIPSGTVVSFNGGAFVIGEFGYTMNQAKDAKATAGHIQVRWLVSHAAIISRTSGSTLPGYRWPIPHRTACRSITMAIGGCTASSMRCCIGQRTAGHCRRSHVWRRQPRRPRPDLVLCGTPASATRDCSPAAATTPRALASSSRRSAATPSASIRTQGSSPATRSFPVRDYEAVLEITYQAQITPWMTLQPDLQHVFHPGGHVLTRTARSGAMRWYSGCTRC